jgi:hypothetical protein
MMKAAEYRECDDIALGRRVGRHRGPLADPLVRPSFVVVADILRHDAFEVPVVEDEHVVEALAPQRAE